MTATIKKQPIKPQSAAKKVTPPVTKKKKIPVRKITSAQKTSLKSVDLQPLVKIKEAEVEKPVIAVKEVEKPVVKELVLAPVEELWLESEETPLASLPVEQEMPTKTAVDIFSDNDLEKKVEKVELKSRSLHLYRKISISFILLTAALLAVIFYFSFVKVNIAVVLKQASVSNNMVVDVYNEGAAARDGAVIGAVSKLRLEQTKNYVSTGSNSVGSEATGTATIINNFSKNQPLVAQTRLLSPDGQLFRLKDTVNVPANGSIKVEIFADQPTKASAIAPSKFTIPGLSSDLQTKIYAETTSAISYQEKLQKYVTQADFDTALADLKQVLVTEAQTQVGDTLKQTYNQVLYQLDDNSVVSTFDAKVNDPKDTFNYKLAADIVVVAFNDQDIKKLAEQKLKDSLSDGQELLSFDQDKLVYTLSSYDATQKSASLNVAFSGTELPKQTAILDKQKLVGLSAGQLNNYLASIPEISSFTVKFSPSFINNVPSLTDRIIIKVDQP